MGGDEQQVIIRQTRVPTPPLPPVTTGKLFSLSELGSPNTQGDNNIDLESGYKNVMIRHILGTVYLV